MKRSFEALIVLGVVAFLVQLRFTEAPEEADSPAVSRTPVVRSTPADPNHQNSFTKLNPNYRVRAGKSYESEYLPSAVLSLGQAASLSEAEVVSVEALLTTFIYHWLDAFVAAGGTRSEQTVEVEAWLDQEFRETFGEEKFSAYLDWKSAPKNKLDFLFLPPPGEQ